MRRRQKGRLHLNTEINVVSLIDVMMLLLVIFMITAPMMQGGVDVALPIAEARPLDSKSSLTVTIDRAGNIFVDRDKMTYREFRTSFKALAGSRAEKGVNVQVDRNASVDLLLKVLAVMRNAGVSNVGLPVEPEPPK